MNTAIEDAMFEVQRSDDVTTRVITGLRVIRFGVPMIGGYANRGTGRTFTITGVVPGVQYRITAWALGDGRRSATPAVVDVTKTEESELPLCTASHTYVCLHSLNSTSCHCFQAITCCRGYPFYCTTSWKCSMAINSLKIII